MNGHLLPFSAVSEGSQPIAATSVMTQLDDESNLGAALKFEKNIYQLKVLEE